MDAHPPEEPAMSSPPDSSWTTPKQLRACVAAVWIGSALVFLVGLQALNADRGALRSIVEDTAPRIVAADELNAQLAGLDTELANSLLGGAADRDVANEMFELRRSAANRRLVDSAANLTAQSAERVPLIVLSEELGRYLELAARAQWLHEGGDRDGSLGLVRLATNLMHARILPAAAALDAMARAGMESQYASARRASRRSMALAVGAGALLVAGLVAGQVVIRRRMRRRTAPVLLAATILAVAFTWYLVARFSRASENLRAVHDDAFSSIHFLWRVRALSFDAAGDQSRWLLDRPRASDYDSAFRAKTTQLLSRPGSWRVGSSDVTSGKVTGLLIDEARNVTFAGEEDAANAALVAFQIYLSADERVRALEKQSKHTDAVDLLLGVRNDGARAAFDKFDAVIQRTLGINREAFTTMAAAADRTLRKAEWLDPAFALLIALLGWLGVRPRLREYM
jgi:hypothetical protein